MARSDCGCFRFASLLGIGAVAATSYSPAAASINLELRPANPTIAAGCPIDLGLYAVSDNQSNQLLSAVQVILTWNVSAVQLVGSNNAGAPPWISSGFLADPYQLNTSLLDGDAMWIGLAPFGAGGAVPATPAGTLLTTIRFQALSNATGTTTVAIAPSGGNPVGQTIVYDGTIPNTNVTGTLSGALVHISACAADMDHDNLVNVNDLLIVINHWGICPPPTGQVCCPGDGNGTGTVDVNDLLIVINGWGPCPAD